MGKPKAKAPPPPQQKELQVAPILEDAVAEDEDPQKKRVTRSSLRFQYLTEAPAQKGSGVTIV
ncbi:hypothetical protein DES46_102344 [Caldimonas thermodepolymerans]|nr:hypothetical protein DES46_102344 [Caldimonas thermodepolymerans]